MIPKLFLYFCINTAVRLSHEHVDAGDAGLANREEHLGAVADDALALHDRADHVPRDVREEQQRDVERVADPDEARRLVGAVREQHACLHRGVVGDDADAASTEAGEADLQLLCIERLVGEVFTTLLVNSFLTLMGQSVCENREEQT